MMPDDRRGQFVARFNHSAGRRRRTSKWHFVDSLSADTVTTYCGRRWRLKARYGDMEFAASDGTYALDPDHCDVCAAQMVARGHAEPATVGAIRSGIRRTA